MPCAACPCPETCLAKHRQFAVFCEWAASDEPVKRQHIIARSALGFTPPPEPEPAPGPSAEPPGLMARAKSFGKAVVAEAAHVASGGDLIGEAEHGRRMAICRSCPEFTGTTCNLCGCVCAWKAKMATQSCPAGKW